MGVLVWRDCLIDRSCIISTALKRQKHDAMKNLQTQAMPDAAAGANDRTEGFRKAAPEEPDAGAGAGVGDSMENTGTSPQPDEAGGTLLAPEAVAELKAQAAKARETYDQLLRTVADFDNYRKRAARERQDAVKFANESLLQKLIPTLDNFDMAMAAAAGAKDGAAQSLQTGVSMILSQLRNTLTEAGLEEIDATGKAFDPNFHEAVSQQETNDLPEGQVVQQLRKGYRLRDRLLRPATVIVAKKPAA
jgi:molecular chaperone GrpE